jgi:hypothetical protein
MITSTLLLALLASPPAEAKKDKGAEEGTRVYVRVVDESNQPIPTAVIRHPDESDRHRVNSVDGTWDEAVLYMPDGSELLFEPGMILELEISAPNYTPRNITYQVRRRNNNVDVILSEVEEVEEEVVSPTIGFGKDTPREDLGSAPAAN